MDVHYVKISHLTTPIVHLKCSVSLLYWGLQYQLVSTATCLYLFLAAP